MEIAELKMSQRVRSNREFSGVAAGTPGIIVERPNSWPDQESVAVRWQRYDGDKLVDWFSFDELEYLDLIK